MSEHKRFSKNYPCCRNCVNLHIFNIVLGLGADAECIHYKSNGKNKKISHYTILMNHKFKPKSCKAFTKERK